jgi:hypothetical protein
MITSRRRITPRLERVADGSMPCDEAWPEDRVALFRRWMDEGFPA